MRTWFLNKDRIDDGTGEQRRHAIGEVKLIVGSAVLLLAVHVYRSENDEEIIRIISAREADKRERRSYSQ
ncbi:MAG: hypothetical protein M3Y72_21860 [Acidobacteriota bacterium]|nr:hypothetical protein [Acidobacteriota bacterium]MDQ2843636.1 hypothetical protein [Acidobacteriota bacterium]